MLLDFMDKRLELHHGDCLQVLRGVLDNSVDSIVTDPPYGLSFMKRKWDYDVPSVEIWAECLRVLKPGGHLLAFAGTRTQHRMAVRIEDAGFEIRDMIAWVYGSGFPKSLDVSRAIDKAQRRNFVLAAVALGMEIPGNNLHDWTKAEHSPGDKWWGEFKAILSPEQWGAIEREVVGQRTTGIGTGGGSTPIMGDGNRDVTAPATEAARQWQGWGTALKPALEPITVARKPLIGTVAANVLAHGTGALNIDGCRVETDDKLGGGHSSKGQQMTGGLERPWMKDPDAVAANAKRSLQAVVKAEELGRWPANLIHDGSEEVLATFPQEVTKSTGGKNSNGGMGKRVLGSYALDRTGQNAGGLGDEGTPARFFYCAKASKRDRGEGNIHPTVKPTDLMAYLCRLVTPPNGTVLDPFMGSGTTGVAALNCGRKFIGIERDDAYFEIAQRRIEDSRGQMCEAPEGIKARMTA